MENINYSFTGGSSKHGSEEDLCEVERPEPVHRSNQAKHQVLTQGIEALKQCSVPVLSLALLAAFLLMLDIGLGVHYGDLKETHLTLSDTELLASDLSQLHSTYKEAIESMSSNKRALDNEMSTQTATKWELEHQTKRAAEYVKRIAQMKVDVVALQERIPKNVTGHSCKPCPQGWLWADSSCFLITFQDFYGNKNWPKAREFCQSYGGDLAIVDTTDKERDIIRYVMNNVNPESQVGFWIGLRGSQNRGIWNWVDGRVLVEGYWQDGEPDVESERACGAAFTTTNFFKAWNDNSCDKVKQKWICEKAQS